MLGILTRGQIDHVLQSQVVGRLACYAGGKLYVVPVTYAYEGNYLYLHSRYGKKIEMMRKNPDVCFQVDQIDNMANWRSVIVWGKFEELKTEQAEQKGLKILSARLGPLITSATTQPELQDSPKTVEKAKKPVTYRIAIAENTGMFEKQDY
jgi:uncharacterized protein